MQLHSHLLWKKNFIRQNKSRMISIVTILRRWA